MKGVLANSDIVGNHFDQVPVGVPAIDRCDWAASACLYLIYKDNVEVQIWCRRPVAWRCHFLSMRARERS